MKAIIKTRLSTDAYPWLYEIRIDGIAFWSTEETKIEDLAMKLHANDVNKIEDLSRKTWKHLLCRAVQMTRFWEKTPERTPQGTSHFTLNP